MLFNPGEHGHRRYNPLTAEWILVSPHRSTRPWQGRHEPGNNQVDVSYDKECYLCPGNRRVNGQLNPDYNETFVFTNDFSALETTRYTRNAPAHRLLINQPVSGTSRVICYSPHHSLTLPQLPADNIRQVIDCWSEQLTDLSKHYQWVQIFENKGPIMGCSNPHPHGQIWATDRLPTMAEKENHNLKQYYQQYGTGLLPDYLAIELEHGQRVVEKNEEWVALVPYWATWPFEMLLIPVRPAQHLNDLDGAQKNALASIMKKALSRYDNLFQTSFPYSMGWHGRPFNEDVNDHWQLHAHFYPPLLRSATVKKYMVGYEMLAEPQRDITPEQAADMLRSCDSVHYLESNL